MKQYILPHASHGICKDNVKGEITMKKQGIGRKLTAVLLTLVMLLSLLPTAAFAAVGDLVAGDTGLSTDIDTSDTISLPIKIYDYKNDGMLFEYAETEVSPSTNNVWLRAENVTKPTSSVLTDFTLGKTDYGAHTYSSATNTSGAATKGNTASLTYLKWAKNNESACLSVFDRAAEGYSATSYAVSAIRYLALVYRSNNGSNNQSVQFDMWNQTDDVRTNKVTASIDNRGTTWRYVVVDLKSTGADLTDKVTAVYGFMPSGIGVAFAGYFSTKAAAETFGQRAIEYTGQTYHYAGDNRAFGLLRYSRTTAYGSNSSTDTISTAHAADGIHMANTYSGTDPLDVSTMDFGYDYRLQGEIGLKGIATLGMLQPDLVNGLPVYKEATVTYVAKLLKDALAIPEDDNTTGYPNYNFVSGVAEARYDNVDFAQWLRNHCKSLGSYAESSKKTLIGKWENVSGNISTWYDAAYFMLNSIFVAGSYNTAMTDYNYLVLSGATNSDGEKVYVFDGGFATSATPASGKSAVKYDQAAQTIQNTSALGKTRYYYEGDNTTTYYPFLPIVDQNGKNTNGVTETPYFLDPGASSKDAGGNTYLNRNFSYVMASNGEFVYHADDELFFEFEGDDDVYLFINDKLVLDIGGAHSITSYKMYVNDYAELLGLEEGGTYPFDFFYMERHAVGANIRIETNIRVTDPSMTTTKTAWQDSVQLEYGSIVDQKKVVEYGFALTNSGKENLYNLTFTDNNIGVKLDPTNGLTYTGSRVYDVNGGKLEASDLTAVVSHPDYADINVTFANNEDLKTFLKNLTADGTEAGGGLFENATVSIRGIGYKLSDAEVEKGVFDNTVLTTATNQTESKTLQGQATMRVFVPADPMYYEWAGHELVITKAKLIGDVLAAANQADNVLNGKVSNLTVNNVTSITVPNQYVTVDSSNNLTVKFPNSGAQVFYATIVYKYNNKEYTVRVPVLVNVTDVQDSVYVLDYGLKVDLTDGGELTKNDAVTVPGRTTGTSVLAIGSNGAYANNEITFSAATPVTGTYGDFAYSNGTIVYTPNGKFIEGLDTVQVAMNVYESDITPSKISGALDINKEVEMYKSITVLPANVVYYEDCFPAITYTGDKTQTNSFSALGSQSNDQDAPYGSDDYYDDDANESAGALTTITINEYATAASFQFKGTGFELIGRTNAADSATLIVRVKDSAGTTVKTIPVITQFDNNNDGGTEEIYQVPVIRVKDLALGTYTVEISGVPAYTYNEDGTKTARTTKLYVDGLRIFQPLGAENGNYTDDENGAAFAEIRNLIVDGKAGVANFTGEVVEFSSSLYTWTENLEAKVESLTDPEVYDVHQVETVDEYLLKGPNNELYMYGEATDQALILYVKENSSTAHALQVGVRAIDRGMFFVGSPANDGIAFDLSYGTKTDAVGWTVIDTVKGSTEQYYTVDYKNCPVVTINGTNYYQVAIKATSGLAAFTSVKYVGLDLAEVVAEEGVSNLVFVEGTLYTPEDTQSYANLSKLSEQMRSTVVNESVPVDEDGLVTAPGGNDDEGSIPVVMGRPGYEDMIAQLLAN